MPTFASRTVIDSLWQCPGATGMKNLQVTHPDFGSFPCRETYLSVLPYAAKLVFFSPLGSSGHDFNPPNFISVTYYKIGNWTQANYSQGFVVGKQNGYAAVKSRRCAADCPSPRLNHGLEDSRQRLQFILYQRVAVLIWIRLRLLVT